MKEAINFKEYLALKKLIKAIEEISDLDEAYDESSDNNVYSDVTDTSNYVVS